MCDHHQMFTVFGGSFVPEAHEAIPPPVQKRKGRPLGPLVMLLIAILLGAAIPAIAVTATIRLRAAEAARWQQPQSTYFLTVPPTVGFDRALF